MTCLGVFGGVLFLIGTRLGWGAFIFVDQSKRAFRTGSRPKKMELERNRERGVDCIIVGVERRWCLVIRLFPREG